MISVLRENGRRWWSLFADNVLIKNSIIYSLGIILNKTIGFFLIPVYTRYFSVSEYGVLSLLTMIAQLVSFFFLMGIGTAATRFYYDTLSDEDYRRNVYGTAFFLSLALPVILAVILGPVIYLLCALFLPSIPFFPLIFIVVITNLFNPMVILAVGYLRIQKKAKVYVIFSLASFLLQSILCILAALWLDLGIRGQLYAQLATMIVFFGVSSILIIRQTGVRFSRAISKKLLRYGVPLIPFFFFSWIDLASGRLLLEKFGSLADVGIFSLAAQFVGIFVVFGNAFDYSMTPIFYEIAQDPDAGDKLGRFALKFFNLFGVGTLFVALFAKPLVLAMADRRYHAAVGYLPFLLLAAFLGLLFKIFNWNLMFSKKTGLLSWITSVTAVLMVVFLVVFLKFFRLGILGVTIAMILVGVVRLIFGYIVSTKHFRLRFDFKKIGVSSLILVAAFVAIAFVRVPASLAAEIGLKSAAFGISAALLLKASGIKTLKLLLSKNLKNSVGA